MAVLHQICTDPQVVGDAELVAELRKVTEALRRWDTRSASRAAQTLQARVEPMLQAKL